MLTASLAIGRPVLGLCPDAAPIQRNLCAPSRRLHPRHHAPTPLLPNCDVRSPLRPAPIPLRRQHPSVRSYLSCARRTQLPRSAPIAPIPRSYGCSAGSGRDDATEGGRRRDATPDLLLKHLNTMVATYVGRQLKHLKHAYETLEKHT